MPILRLTENGWIQKFLISQPEKGQGYHIVEIYLKDGSFIQDVKVFNCEEMVLPDQHRTVAEKDIAKVVNVRHLFRTPRINPNP